MGFRWLAGNLWGEEPVPQLDCGDRYTTVCVCQLEELCTKKGKFPVTIEQII